MLESRKVFDSSEVAIPASPATTLALVRVQMWSWYQRVVASCLLG